MPKLSFGHTKKSKEKPNVDVTELLYESKKGAVASFLSLKYFSLTREVSLYIEFFVVY